MNAVSLNSLNLQSGGYKTESVIHENISSDLNEIKIPHKDGAKLVSYNYGSRAIVLKGSLTAASSALLETAIDTFKSTVIGAMDVNLDLGYAGGTRRYKVNVKNITLPREYYNITFIGWTIECEAIDPPFGLDTTSTTGYIISNESGDLSDDLDILGSAKPQPIITLTVNTASGMTDFTFTNTTTNTAITVKPASIANNDVFVIDTENYTIKKNGTEILTIDGVYPLFNLGDNNFTVETDCTSYNLTITYTKRWL